MNEIKVTREILNNIYDDDKFKSEVAELINSLIDEELLKDEPDCDFIDECINTLDELENDSYINVIPFVKKHAGKAAKNKVISIAAACAILAAISFCAVAVSHTIEKKKEAQTTTIPPTTEITTTAITTTTKAVPTTEPPPQAAVPMGIKLSFGKNFKDEYTVGEKLDTTGISVVITYTDGTEKTVPIDDCKVTTDDGFGTMERYETVTVSCDGFFDSFKVRVLRNEETRVLNSIYAEFPDDFDFTSDDIENTDLSGMKVFAVYSDKSEEQVSTEEYSIEKEMIDKKTMLYTITYKGCSTSFGIKERR